jgi:hypothetical protein
MCQWFVTVRQQPGPLVRRTTQTVQQQLLRFQPRQAPGLGGAQSVFQ